MIIFHFLPFWVHRAKGGYSGMEGFPRGSPSVSFSDWSKKETFCFFQQIQAIFSKQHQKKNFFSNVMLANSFSFKSDAKNERRKRKTVEIFSVPTCFTQSKKNFLRKFVLQKNPIFLTKQSKEIFLQLSLKNTIQFLEYDFFPFFLFFYFSFYGGTI